MRNADPTENIGIIRDHDSGAFLGSCFIFRYPEVVLTADHVVRSRAPDKLIVCLPGSQAAATEFAVHEIIRHPTADLAVVRIDPPNERDITWPSYSLFNDQSLGLEVVAYGFPQNSNDGKLSPTPRLFRGHVQRFFEHTSHNGYKYIAAELNFSCPAGLSGSHVFNSKFHGRLYGVMTENFQTSTELDSVLEVDDDGQKYKESFHNIISYGVALWLPACANWLDTIVAPVSQDEIHRRAKNQHCWKIEDAEK